MNNLTVIENNGILVVDSREVAGMLNMRHDNLVRDIEKYIETFENSETSKLRFDDFFIESSYSAGTGKNYKNYLLTKKGCELVAHKRTGQDGIIFTATYVDRFHAMENHIKDTAKIPKNKSVDQEIKLKNSRARTANAYLKIANNTALPNEYRQIMLTYAANELSGTALIPLPKSEKRTYSATEIGEKLGVSANKIGTIANANNLKTDEYGIFVWDKSRYSNKEVESFRYYENVIPVLEKLLKVA